MFTVHYTTRNRVTGSQSFATQYGAEQFERYLDAIGASYDREAL